MLAALATRLLALFGVSLSPFWAAFIAFGIIGAAGGVGAIKLYEAGKASAESKCQVDALQAEVDAMKKDRDDARAAAADVTLKLAAIKKQTDDEKEGTAAYVAELEKRADASRKEADACRLTCDDLRGMRISSKSCPGTAGARPAGGARRTPAASASPSSWFKR